MSTSLKKIGIALASTANAGFTLLEMLMVVALLAVIAGLGVAAYDTSGNDDAIATQLAQSEMTELAKALRQFRRDVGRYPHVPDAQLSSSPPFHPADFSQLFVFTDKKENSTGLEYVEGQLRDGLDDNSDYRQFNRDTGRGWNGPYLEQRGMACVRITNYLPGPPTERFVYTKLDPFRHQVDAGALKNNVEWRANNGNACSAPVEPLKGRQGMPYLLLLSKVDCVNDLLWVGKPREEAETLIDNPLYCRPRIVSLGADGKYGGANIDLNNNQPDVCQPYRAVEDGKDDLVLCL